MQIVDSHNELEHSRLYQLRLFYLQRPLLPYRKNVGSCPIWKDILDFSGGQEVCFIDSAGWIFPIDSCVVESSFYSRKWHRLSKILDYTERAFTHPKVIAYAPCLLRYCTIDTFNRFLDSWVADEMLLYLDKRLVQHNYLKFNLADLTSKNLAIVEDAADGLTKWQIKRID